MRAAHQVLTDAGFRVSLPTQHLCCGRPLYDFGMLDTAKEYLLKVLNALDPATRSRHPHRRPRTQLRLRLPRRAHQPPPQRPPSRKLRSQTYLLSEFLVKFAPNYQPPQLSRKNPRPRPLPSPRHHGHDRRDGAPPRSPEPKSNSSTQAAAAWPAPSASKKTNTKSPKN